MSANSRPIALLIGRSIADRSRPLGVLITPTYKAAMSRQTFIRTPLPEDRLQLRRFQYAEELGRPFRLEVELTSTSQELGLESLISQRVTVVLMQPRGGERFFNGVVSEFCQTEARGRFAVYRATVVPWLWLLTQTSDCRIFQNRTVPDIIKAVFKEYGFDEVVDELKGDYSAREYCVQYRETDFAFVSRLMECEGIYYHWRHAADRHELVLVDDASAHAPHPGHEWQTFHAGGQVREGGECVVDWAVRQRLSPAVVALKDFNPEKPVLPLLAKSSIQRPHAGDPWEIFDYPGGYGALANGERYAQLRIQELQAGYEVASGVSNSRGLAAGCCFDLQEHPRRDWNRQYLVTSCHYDVAAERYESEPEGPSPFELRCAFQAIDAREQFRPARHTPRPVVQGPQTAMVVGRKGRKIDVDPEGRVKVQFHWDRYGQRDLESSCWIRVSHPWAGAGYGGMIIPRIGHEVIVEFLEGDPDRPIITGRVYNGGSKAGASNAGRDGKPGNAPPKDIAGADVMTSFKSDSLAGGGGNEITMNDSPGAEGLFFKAHKDEIHQVANDREDSVGNNETRKVSVDRSREVGNNESIKIGVNRSETVGTNQTEKVGSNMSVTVGANLVETIGMAAAENVGLAKALSVGAGYQISVGAAMNTTVALVQAEQIGLVKHTIVGVKYMIQCGASSITLEAGGKVTIKGTEFEFAASGPVKINGSIVDIN